MSHAAPITEAEPGQGPLFVSAKEAARLLSLSRSRIYQLMDDGTITSHRLGRRRVIPADALANLAAELRTR